ncbi:MAG: caspase family protein [Paracoccaceae bacterium]
MKLFTLATSLMIATAALAEDRALVIGIDDYSALAEANDLNGAAADAERIETFLTDTLAFPSGSITRLTNAAASSDAILSTLIDTVVRETNPGERVVFYFAGLGTVLPDGTPALIAHDGNTLLGQIPLGTLAEIIGVIADRDVAVFLDASFDGGPFGTRGLPGANASAFPEFDASLWMAAQTGQFAWEAVDRGVFTDALLDGAVHGDANSDGTVTNGEMLSHTTMLMQSWCEDHAACSITGRGFAPAFSGDEAGVLATKSAPIVVPVIAEPIIKDDGLPASFRETLGFVTDLFAPSNDARLTLSIKGGDALQVGDLVSFTVSADRPGTLLLLDVDPVGQLAQVYPSQLSAEDGTRVSPGQPLIIPSALGANGRPLRIRVTEPSGQGLLLGLFIEGDLPQLTALLPAGINGGPVPNASQSLFEISQRLLRLEADADQPIAWSATYLPYRIEP